jgi:hypothetical protein
VRGCLSPLLNLSEKSYVTGFQRVVDPKESSSPVFLLLIRGLTPPPFFNLHASARRYRAAAAGANPAAGLDVGGNFPLSPLYLLEIAHLAYKGKQEATWQVQRNSMTVFYSR